MRDTYEAILLDGLNHGVIIVDSDAWVTRWNSWMAERTGQDEAAVVGRSLFELYPDLQQRVAGKHVMSCLQHNRPAFLSTHFHQYLVPIAIEHPSGQQHMLQSVKIFPMELQRNGGAIIIIDDVTEQVLFERESASLQHALAAEKEQFKVTLISIGDGVISTDCDGRVTLMNKVAEELTGWESDEAMGRPVSEVFRLIDERTHEPLKNPIDRVLSESTVVTNISSTLLVSRAGKRTAVADSCASIINQDGLVFGMVLVFQDVTERRQLEEEQWRIAKMESLGSFAGGIAHDFNNILTAISGNVTIAQTLVPAEGELDEILSDVQRAAGRAQSLARHLLTFSKGGAPVKEAVQIGEVVQSCALFVLAGSKCKVEFSIPDDLIPVDADVGQLSQVVENIVLNAKQSMPQGGQIHVSACNLPDAASHPLLDSGTRYVKLTFADRGIGMAEDQLSRIFDPFYSNKTGGSGLGLAIVHSIVKRHGGQVEADSRPGEGTTFDVYLPASKGGQSRSAPAPKLNVKRWQGVPELRVLVMDDEVFIHRVLARMARICGWTGKFASDGETAIHIYEEALQEGNPFDVVILDLTVPGGMGGEKTLARLRVIDPEVRAIVTSGYSESPILASYEEYGFSGRLVKPFTIDDLKRVLGECPRRSVPADHVE